MRQIRNVRCPSGGSSPGSRETGDALTRFLAGVGLLGVLILLLAAIGWGPKSAYGQDATGQRFRAGMEALAAAHAVADREARDEKLDEAITAFRAILVDRPELVRVRLELARAFFLKQEDRLARRHFEQVLAGDVPPAVAANIQRFLQTMRARRRWEAWFGAAIAPDSNLNAASGERTVFLDTQFGRLPFTLDDPATPESGLGLSIWGGGEYQYPLSHNLRLRSGANANIREYKGRDFDRHFVSAHLGPRRLIDARTEASLLATLDRQWTAGAPETDRFGLRLEGEHRLTPRFVLFARASAARRNCRDCNHLDGPEGDVLLGAVWAALPILRFSGNAGWNWSRANSEHWRNSGPRAGLGATLALPAGFTVGLRASLQRTEYQGRGFAHNTIDREPREDETQTLSLSVHNRAFTVAGFSPRLSLVREERETNAQALDYDRNRAELSFVRQF
ncbi:MAG: DUF560 domain-containing protein [Alphaproteobacteria bacterium]|nr:DUF560 domain-containing protein [Alphaproteobacteria bacterium]